MLSKEEYFFMEWLIIEKKLTREDIEKMTKEQFLKLRREWVESVYE